MLGNLNKLKVSGACPICLEDMDTPQKIVITKCSHAFHEQCMTFQFDINESTSCPYCRQIPVPMVRAEEVPGHLETNPYIESKMIRALRDGDIDYVHAALLAEPHLVEQLFEHKDNGVKYPLLTLAVMFGYQELVVSLLKMIKQESIDEFSSDGFNALSIACLFGHTQIVRSLLDANAEVNNINRYGKNALWFAASIGKKEIIELLVKFGASVTSKAKGDFTALFIAAQNGHLDTVNYLISVIPKAELKEQVNICSSSEPGTALYVAAQEGHTNIVSSLLLAGADPNQALIGDKIPLHIAALNGHLEIVKLLIEKGTDVNFRSLNNSVTALFCAAAEGHKEICKCLLEANADPNVGYEDSVSGRRISVAKMARDSGHFELADYIENFSHS